MRKNAEETFNTVINDTLTVEQRSFLERLGKDSRKVIKVDYENRDLLESCDDLVGDGLIEVTSSRSTINFKITKKGKGLL